MAGLFPFNGVTISHRAFMEKVKLLIEGEIKGFELIWVNDMLSIVTIDEPDFPEIRTSKFLGFSFLKKRTCRSEIAYLTLLSPNKDGNRILRLIVQGEKYIPISNHLFEVLSKVMSESKLDVEVDLYLRTINPIKWSE